jgi:hypothetical protein
MELEVFFTIQQTYFVLVISFMNRKSSCGYATHFFLMLSLFQYFVHFMKICKLEHTIYVMEYSN